VLPSQIRTLLSCPESLNANAFGGGANGQPGARDIGNSAISMAVPVEISVIVLLG
jgi:hypothetical protein